MPDQDVRKTAIAAVRAGYAVVPLAPGTDEPLCTVARGKAEHECGVHHAITDDALAGRVFRRLADKHGRVGIGIVHHPSRLVAVTGPQEAMTARMGYELTPNQRQGPWLFTVEEEVVPGAVETADGLTVDWGWSVTPVLVDGDRLRPTGDILPAPEWLMDIITGRARLIEDGKALRDRGLRIIPVGADKRPVPGRRWAGDQLAPLPTDEQIEAMVRGWDTHGWAVLCGAEDGIACLDIEGAGMAVPAIAAVAESAPETCRYTSPSGGTHVWLDVSDAVLETGALARQDRGAEEENRWAMLAEIRGASPVKEDGTRLSGAYAVIVGPGRPPLRADFAPWKVTRAEAEALFTDIRDVDEHGPWKAAREAEKAANRVVRVKHTKERTERLRTGTSTADVIRQAAEDGWLEPTHYLPDGWEYVGDEGGRQLIRRPGAESEQSGNVKDGIVVIHSTSVEWAEPGETMPVALTMAKGRHDGDFGAAMRAVEDAAAGKTSPYSDWPTEVLDAVRQVKRDEGLWSRRPFLAHLAAEAKFRMVSPWALLAAVLTRTSAEVDPHVQLPDVVVAASSLNLFSCILGYPGQGKSGTASAADELRLWEATAFDFGSTEGLIDIYVETVPWRKKDDDDVFTDPWERIPGHFDLRQKVRRGYAETDELSTFLGQTERAGNTIRGTLLSAYFAKRINPAYRGNKAHLPTHRYRLAWLVGAQVDLAWKVIDQQDVGLPQRLLWASSREPQPEIGAPKPEGLLPWKVPADAQMPGVVRYIDVPDAIVDEVRQVRARVVAATSADLGSHRMLTRLRVAALLALIEGRYNIDDEDWHLSDLIVAHSDACIEMVMAERAKRTAAATKSTGEARAAAALAGAEYVAERVTEHAAQMVARYVHKHGQVTRKQTKYAAGKWRHRDGFDLDDVLAYAVEQKWVVPVEREGRGSKTGKTVTDYAPGPSQPTDAK
ncbi:MAG: bifunctional DNA primase/polymerase [Actinobacteria bacterium]|nr:bifunctional DNA primase/polymerase [Actinomycetota bacterium]